jgi:hypothetical protein
LLEEADWGAGLWLIVVDFFVGYIDCCIAHLAVLEFQYVRKCAVFANPTVLITFRFVLW